MIAGQRSISVPTASREVNRALGQLGEVVRGMGVPGANGRIVTDHFGVELAPDDFDDASDHGDLRFAPDWRSAELTPLGAAPDESLLLPGWTRPLRALSRLLSGQWSTSDTNKLRRGIRRAQALVPLVPREFKRRHLVSALRTAQDTTPITHAEAALIPVPLAPPDGRLPDVFVWAVIDWHFRTQRPQHLAAALAGKGHRVFYVSNNFVDERAPGFSILPLTDTL